MIKDVSYLNKSKKDCKYFVCKQKNKDVLADNGNICFLAKDLLKEIKDLNVQIKNLSIENKKLISLSSMDDLTCLYNIRSFNKILQREYQRAIRYNKSLGLIMLDIDDFKLVNDNHNHLMGSFVLKEVANLISFISRSSDIAARYGGDEYIILLPESDKDGCINFAKRLKNIISDHVYVKYGFKIKITASIGVCIYPFEGCNINSYEDLIKIADLNLYKAKKNGKNCIIGG